MSMSSLAPDDGRSWAVGRLALGALVLVALAGYHAGAAPPLGAARTAVANEVLSDKEMGRLRVSFRPGSEGIGSEPSDRGAGEAQSPVARVAPAPEPGAVASRSGAAFFVQLGAFTNEANVEPAWELLRRQHGEILGTLEPTIERAATDRGLLFHRILVGPFASRGAAAEACRALQQRQQDCFVRGPA
jgi:hypothetical protein